MALLVLFLRLPSNQLGINLSSRDARMTQQLLDLNERRTPLQQMGSEAMAEGMRRDVLFDSSLLGIGL